MRPLFKSSARPRVTISRLMGRRVEVTDRAETAPGMTCLMDLLEIQQVL